MFDRGDDPRTKEYSCRSQLQYQDIIRGYWVGNRTGHTLSVDPKERTFRSPLLVNVSFEEPGCSFFVMSITRNVMVS
jgi:hypothetical protein